MNWLHSALLGFVSGLYELLPLSASAGRGLLRQLLGMPAEEPLFSLAYRAAVLTVLLTSGVLELRRLRRTAKILRMPPRRRTGHPSLNESGTIRLLRAAALPALAGGILASRLTHIADRLWLVVIPLVLCGLLLWLPVHMPGANKDGRHLSAAEGLLMGLGTLTAAVPGVSPVAAVIAIGAMRGAQKKYALRFAWLLLSVYLAGGMVMDLLALAASGVSLAASSLISAAIGAAAAAVGAYLAVQAVRFLIRRRGLFDFCYYSWGQALLSLVLFLVV